MTSALTRLHMKKTTLVRALVLASLAIAAKGYSQAPAPTVIPGSVSKVTFALTLSSSTPSLKGETGPVDLIVSAPKTTPKGEVVTTTQGTKIVAAKYSNKEILTDLLKVTKNIVDIKGWYIEKIQVTSIVDGEPDPGSVLFFLSNKNEVNSINVTNRIQLGSDGKITGINRKDVKTTPSGEGATPTTVTTYSENLKFVGGFEIDATADAENSPEKIIEASAVYAGSQKLGALKNADKTQVILSGAGKITGVAGEDSSGAIVEGSVSFGAGAAVDVAGVKYFPAL